MSVFVVQEPKPGPNGFTYDISPSLNFGQPIFVFEAGAQPGLNPGPSTLIAKRKLDGFNADTDFLLWAGGDPAGLAIVCIVLADITGGRFQFLRWERERDRNSTRTGRGYYLPVRLNTVGR